jgi:Cys-rich protein (TIGR01571 family)
MAAVVINAPNVNVPIFKKAAWSTDLSDMCALPGGAGRAFYTLLFPGCAHGEMAAIAPPGSVACSGNCYGACCLWGCFGPLFTCLASQGLRAHYGIPGSIGGDILAGLCTPCGVLQQHREVLIRRGMAGAIHSAQVVMMPVLPTVTYAPAPMAMGQPMMQQQMPASPVAQVPSPLAQWVTKNDLDAAVEAELRHAGVVVVDDLSHLSGDDVQAMALNIVQKKKLCAALGK